MSKIDSQIREHQERQAALHEIHLAITSTLDLRERLSLLIEGIAAYRPQYAIRIRLWNQTTGTLETLASRNFDEADWNNTPSGPCKGLMAEVLETKKPLFIANLQNDPRIRRPEFVRRHGLVSYLAVPLLVRNDVIGVLTFCTRQSHEFSRDEISFLDTLAGQAAVAISNSQLFEQLKAANEALQKSLEIESVLVGVMAHELKTPIQLIMGNANLLSDGVFGELTDEQLQRVHAIEKGTEELLHLIESALDMTRLKHGKMPLVVTETSLAALFTEIRSEFEDGFRKKGLELEVCEPPTDWILKTDRVKLKEILRNLLENAQKFTASGYVKLDCRLNRQEEVEIVVKDTGIGIVKENLPRIFDLFYQVDPAAGANTASAGLGLAIVKRLVTAMSGNIDVNSEIGKGTAFRVVLPKEIPCA